MQHPTAASASSPYKASLASRQARRQVRHLWITLVGALFLVPAYMVAQYMTKQGWVTTLYPQTVAWCIPPYMVAAHLLYRSINIPAAEQRTMLLINTLVPYLALVLVLALLQEPYSRGAVLMVTVLTTLWYWLCDKFFQKQEKLHLLCLDESVATELNDEMGNQAPLLSQHVQLVSWQDSTTNLPDCDGAVISRTHNLTPAQESQLARIKQHHIRLYSAAAVAESLTGRKSQQELRNPLWQPDGNPAYDSIKRLTDVVVVLLTAPGWIPLGLLTAIAIKLDTPGPALFSQMRTGLQGRPFRIWKFRTMVVQKDAQAQFAQANDKRITRLGHFLRKSRLDEIPQLVNVLLGHMSLIGPRPEQHSFVNDFAIRIPSYPYRHLVRPGITGWAQVMQGYAASEEETVIKLSYDLYYVSHYSLALDLLIVVKTIRTILTGHGAR